MVNPGVRRLYRRRRGRRQRFVRPRIAPSRVRRVMRLGRSLPSAHFFKRKRFVGTIQLSNLGDTLGSYVFKLSDLPDYSEFVNLFDQYRINRVSVIFEPQWTSNDANPATTLTTMPDIRTIVDYTDSGLPASFDEMYQYTKCKITRGGRIHKRIFTPAILASSYETITTAAYTPKWKQWLTTDDPATPHYCLKYGIDKLTTGLSQNFYVRVYMTYYIQCKNVK